MIRFTKTILLFLLVIVLFSGSESCTKIHLGTSDDESVETPPNLRNKPNIVIIMADDIGYEIPKINGGQSYATPNIDLMSQLGVSFTQCYAAPSSSPSRFMLMTGKYNFRNYTTWGSLPLSEHTLANVFHENGYTNCAAGGWQFDNGAAALDTFGFDTYCVYNPFKKGNEEEADSSFYKNPSIYQNGGYLPASVTTGKYGPDMMNQYVMDFIDSNANKDNPFLVYYSLPLCRKPFSPTPDDAEFAGWDPTARVSDIKYFSSMVKYMDKSVGAIINKLKTAGVEGTTLVFFVSDNGTAQEISSYYKGEIIQGAQGNTIKYGTHVPLIAYCPGSVSAGICHSIIDFTDFFPTLVQTAGVTVPAAWTDTRDGVSFRTPMLRTYLKSRNEIYQWYNPHPDQFPGAQKVFVQDTSYKLYQFGGFYNVAADPKETTKIPEASFTQQEKKTKYLFQQAIDSIK